MRRVWKWEFTNAELAIIAFVVAASLTRFHGVAHSPPGYFADEASLSGHVSCLLKNGWDAYGHRWPLFSLNDPVLKDGGEFGPFILYPMLVWARVFGTSITAMRSFNVAASLVAVLATAGVMRNLLGRKAFFWSLVLGVISPWSFHAGRVAFGTVVSLAFLMGGTYFFTRGGMERRLSWANCAWAAGLWAAAMYFQRVSLGVLAVGGLLVIWSWRKGLISRAHAAGMVAVGGVVLLPYLAHIRGSSNATRAQSVTILNPYWRRVNGVSSLWDLGVVFVENVGRHLSPSFLIFRGDHNFRHGVGFVGQLSWPASLLVFGLPIICAVLWRHRANLVMESRVIVVAAVGVIAGIVPAALTTPETLPHANRSIGAEPFFIVLAVVAALLLQRIKVPVAEVMIGVTALFVVFFLPRYFNDMPVKAYGDFQSTIRADAEEAAKTGSMLGFLKKYREWNPRSMFIYFSVRQGGVCPSPVD